MVRRWSLIGHVLILHYPQLKSTHQHVVDGVALVMRAVWRVTHGTEQHLPQNKLKTQQEMLGNDLEERQQTKHLLARGVDWAGGRALTPSRAPQWWGTPPQLPYSDAQCESSR